MLFVSRSNNIAIYNGQKFWNWDDVEKYVLLRQDGTYYFTCEMWDIHTV